MLILLRDVSVCKKKSRDTKLLQYSKKVEENKEKKKYPPPERYDLTLRSIDGYLTRREVECIALTTVVQKGQIVADYLGISNRTVDYYLRNAIRRFKCHSRVELIKLVLASDFRQKLTEICQLLLAKHQIKSLNKD